MGRRLTLLSLVATVSLTACDQPAPGGAGPELGLIGTLTGTVTSTVDAVSDDLLRVAKWAPVNGPRHFRYSDNATNAGFLPVLGYEVGFWAVKGQDRSLAIDYQGADGQWRSYIRLGVPAGALHKRPDGTHFAVGDSVRIVVQLDTAVIRVHMEPTGLKFRDDVPAQLRWWYTGADPDFNGDGVVNLLDDVAEEALVIRVQQDLGDPWKLLSAIQSLFDQRFDADLKHFSGYAVSW